VDLAAASEGWFPAQATLVVGGVSVEPDRFLSDPLGTMEGVLAGTTSQTDILYALPSGTDLSTVTTAEGRLVGGAPFDAGTFEDVGEELDMTFSWQPE